MRGAAQAQSGGAFRGRVFYGAFDERYEAKLTQRLGVLSRHWVMTIHGLCATIIREYPREAGFDGEETMLSEPESALLWSARLRLFGWRTTFRMT